jgi:formylglycine-generating enzyme required for sulfatase activity
MGQAALAHALVLNAYCAHPEHYAVLLELRRYLAGQPRPQLAGLIAGRIEALEARIDEIRTRSEPAEQTWRALEALGYARRVDMVQIPAGPFKHGTDEPSRIGDLRLRTVETRAYWIDRHEVRIRDYLRFVRSTRAAMPSGLALPVADERLDHPVTGVDLAGASAYARWVGKRLPDELEWAKAARGEIYRRYPWGDDFSSRNANTAESRRGGTAPAGSYARDVSPYQVYDMGGNVAEWTTSEFDNRFVPRPMVVLGGSFRSPPVECLISTRVSLPPGDTRDDVGFRCASD